MSYQHGNQCARSWSKAPQVSTKKFHVWEKFERNCPLVGQYCIFQGRKRLYVARFFANTHNIWIMQYISSFRKTLPLEPMLSIKLFVKWLRRCKKKKNIYIYFVFFPDWAKRATSLQKYIYILLQTSPRFFAQSGKKTKHRSTILWTL